MFVAIFALSGLHNFFLYLLWWTSWS